ncbi:transposase [Streptomyces sp. NPDC050698]
MITDGHGTPLAVLLTGGNRNDVTQLLPLLDAIPPVRGRVGIFAGSRTRCSPTAGTTTTSTATRSARPRHRARHRPPRHPARHRTGHHRWVVERSFAWLHGFRRLRIRWERRADVHEAFLKLSLAA